MIKNYLKIALAVFRRRPFFTVVSLFAIAVTLSVILVATALLDHVFAGTPPEVHQRRTLGIFRVALFSSDGEGGMASALASHRLLDQSLRDLPGAEAVSISSIFWKSVSYVGGQRVDSYLKYTDAAFWQILQFSFLEGRPYDRDEVEGAAPVAVINRATRERFFGGEPAVGKTVEVDGERYRVVGVVDNVPMLRLVVFADIWVPYTHEKTHRSRTELIGTWLGLILAEDRSRLEGIRQEYAHRMANTDLSDQERFDTIICVPETTFESVARVAFSLGKTEVDQSARLLRWLVILAVIFMILPTINLVNLNISRIMERASEIGVRKAFGAPSMTLIGQFVVENVILTAAGGLVAVVATQVILHLISAAGWIPYVHLQLNLRILGIALAATLFFGLFSGVYPAWRMSRMHPVDALRGGGSA